MRKIKSWAELEQRTGIQRTTPPGFTRRDAANLTAKRLRGPFWKRKR